jgi:hypothetical protein
VLANRIYAGAEKDGTAIAILERGVPQLAIQGDPNARFDPLKMTWLGSVSSYAHDAYIFWLNASFAAKTVADLKPPSTITARVGTTGAGATNLVFTVLAKDVLGLNVQNVRGYRGAADAFLAQQRSEIDGQVVGLSSVKVGQPALYQANFLRPLIAFARTTRFPDYPDVPTGRELATTPKAQAILAFAEAPFFMALPVAAPPDLPPERAPCAAGCLHGHDPRPCLHRGGEPDEPRAKPDRRRSRAGDHRPDERNPEGRDRAVQRDGWGEELNEQSVVSRLG